MDGRLGEVSDSPSHPSLSSALPPCQTTSPKYLNSVVRFETPICPLSFEAFPPLPAAFEPPGFAPSGIQAAPLRSAEPVSLWSKKSPSHPQAN
ncbi:hypothetical protein Nepgr_002790 [Nepenthes gracilis]|uniref:Uncharacterized protein n=1 Tax=Nepenthes gracilis TaxID=150966 RepID=A0AAD3RYH1_NEPGR|nr:hypothetical protein Nepgr_002790 [Nepenthes gracilis]